MSRTDRRFAAGTVALTLLVPGVLLALTPFGEARASLGTLVGWAAALLIMVPSYLLLSRSLNGNDTQRFFRSFLAGTTLRLLLTVAAVLLFATQVEQPPIKTFVLAFFLGYLLLTGLELTLTVHHGGRKPAKGMSA